ncbi:MAG: prolyl oligopeptidase family serine peptidase [Alphaproteobacteria bacterium]|nr:prolyl oligopeptidase family serine peptidase [Alphaproteobacteria bacterium]
MSLSKVVAAAAVATLLSGCAAMSSLTQRADPYLYMEDVEGPRALEWVRAQNTRTLAELKADPRFAQLEADARAIVNARDRLPTGAVRGGYVYNFWQDEAQVRGAWRRSPIADFTAGKPVWETLLDVDALSVAENKNWVFQGATCLPPEETRCLIRLSDGGKDAAVRREYDIKAKAFVPGGFSLPEAKSDVQWKDADTPYVATDWGPGSLSESGYPIVVKELRRGAPLSSAVEIMRGDVSDVGVFMSAFTGEDGQRAVIAAEAQTFFSSVYKRLDAQGGPQTLTLPGRATLRGLHKGELVFTTEEDWTPPGGATKFARGSLLSMPLSAASSAAPPVRLLYGPGPRESVEDVAIARDAVIVSLYRNVRAAMLRLTFDGRAWVESQIPLPPNGAVTIAGAASDTSTAFAVFEDFLRPDTLYALDSTTGSAKQVRALTPKFDASRFVSEQYEATSRDGTKVPYFIIRAKDVKLDGSNPTLLYGYGGFQISMTPAYSAFTGKLWLERGGVYVLANIRGGGEFGPAWHQAGLKTNRQVVYDDFIAVAEDLIARKITSPRRLGIMGGSNGGLLMGVMLTQRPELFNAAVVQVPLLDMLRYNQMLAGASWVDEYGDPTIGPNGRPTHPDERKFLEKLSPYANLRKRADYPVPFLVTSTKDDRVHPAHARKYGARLEELGMPFYYYENIDGGHSAAANLQEQASRRALEMTYLMKRLMD